jgi:hypothetical protein
MLMDLLAEHGAAKPSLHYLQTSPQRQDFQGMFLCSISRKKKFTNFDVQIPLEIFTFKIPDIYPITTA